MNKSLQTTLHRIFLTAILLVICQFTAFPQDHLKTINDVTQLNPIRVNEVITPVSVEEIIKAVKAHQGPISIGGGRYSMGGQTATEKALQIDTRQFNKVVHFSKEKKEITVQAGITWRKLQEFIDPHNLSVQIKQTYSNFTVGGSLSVNVHGRYIGLGPLILSVKSIRIILPDGKLLHASPSENPQIFYGAIGGYGALGVIAEATLYLTENIKVARKSEVMPVTSYKNYFFNSIRNDSSVIFHNADVYPDEYTTVRAISYVKTDEEVTVKDRLIPENRSYWLDRLVFWIISEMPFGKWFRESIIDRIVYWGDRVLWRNYEASYDVKELEPSSRSASTYVLQEYFIPVENFDLFVPSMAEILTRHDVNVINVSIRHAKQDPGSLLAWAKTEVLALVLYYKQGTTEYEKKAVAVWTRELIDAAISLRGAYYLPYQIHATDQQFRTAYPKADTFFVLKKQIDPENKFRNKLWDAYYHPATEKDSIKISPDILQKSRIKTILADKKKSDGIYLFLQNVYGLYPTDQFHYLIKETSEKYNTDKEIYEAIQQRIPEITPALWSFRYALPALNVQKEEIAQQTAELLGKRDTINGYLEIGTTGRYVNFLEDLIPMEGPVYISNNESPSYSIQEIMERGQLTKIGTYFDMDNYHPISANQIPDESLDLVTIYIGLHHAPADKLDAYIKSVWRVLRPGGRLIVRDHDVTSPEFGEFVSVVHDIFYCGLGESWEYTNKEIRNFSSSKGLANYLEDRGFKSDQRRVLQKNDPSKNTLMVFTKGITTDLESTIRTELWNLKNYKRDEAQTYLTLPEWYLVYSPAEYADVLKNKRPSSFPYFGSIKQFWSYYRNVYLVTKDKYEVNWGYHFMVFVIGASFTIENTIKGIYEKTIGRFSEWISGGAKTKEDVFAAQVAQDYVDFIRVRPWYEFPFATQFKKVWSIPLSRKSIIRQWSRKIFLSAEYGGKAVYGKLIGMGTQSVYGVAEDKILLRASTISAEKLKEEPKVTILKTFNDSTMLLSFPRYEEFRDVTIRLVKKGIRFKEIAGNEDILITCMVPTAWKYDLSSGQLLFEKPILTNRKLKRIAVKASVKLLHEIILQLTDKGISVEHIYDY